ncbi:BlaI/MecI/CopY family transcriptional regulator [Streptomyces gobiensis]|uniref:BlaI/MecI/CopY family transcriptional regulator n=1 Tax=Streptomyces gobiensis TaxID=2875706 RepID=UPI001E4B2E3A|nr:BlaI/MecI/CopY family transcriptional regulator [Streptomyces gobiensis]UGY91272.1 BlaI/MecI/CopY family transcriptional regulator [Streptomyces gobiensis]
MTGAAHAGVLVDLDGARAPRTMALRFSWREAAGMRGFGELEQAIMDVVWASVAPLTVREVLEKLNRDRPQQLAYNTVQTVMEILHRKGWLSRAKEGRAFRYQATKDREEYAASLIDQVWATGADRTATLVRLFDELDEAEVDELRTALAARRDGSRS